MEILDEILKTLVIALLIFQTSIVLLTDRMLYSMFPKQFPKYKNRLNKQRRYTAIFIFVLIIVIFVRSCQ